MVQLQPVRFLASVILSICLLVSPPVTVAGDVSPASLPSVEALEKAQYEPVPPPNLAGIPTYEDLVDVLNSFGSYVRGSAIVAKYEEPVLTRGAVGVSLFRRVSPAVVLVLAAKFVGDQVSDMSEGTGVIVDPRGYVLTNWHVVAGYESALVFLKPAGQAVLVQSLAYTVRLVKYDSSKDLALLRMIEPPPNLPAVQLVAMTQVEVGQNIHVIGHPGGSEHAWSYTTGVVSQIRRNYIAAFASGPRMQANLVQIQTAVNPGNSGGPVFNDSGGVIGLVTFGFTEMQNLNFAVASDEISHFLAQSLQATTRGASAPGRRAEKKGEFSGGQLSDGKRVFQARFPDLTAFLVQNPNGKWIGLVAKHQSGLVLSAWEPGVAGGFDQWQLILKDGTTLKAKGRGGLPGVFGGT